MDDDPFLRALESGTFPAAEMNHRAHLRLAWVLRQRGQLDSLPALLQRYVSAIGAASKYDEALTRWWMQRIASHPATSLDELLAAFGQTKAGDSGTPYESPTNG